MTTVTSDAIAEIGRAAVPRTQGRSTKTATVELIEDRLARRQELPGACCRRSRRRCT